MMDPESIMLSDISQMEKNKCDFTRMRGAKQEQQMNKQNKHAEKKVKLVDTDNRTVVPREGWRGSQRGQAESNTRGQEPGRWARSRAYRCRIIRMYTWHLYNVVSQCHPDQFNKNFKKLKVKATGNTANMKNLNYPLIYHVLHYINMVWAIWPTCSVQYSDFRIKGVFYIDRATV